MPGGVEIFDAHTHIGANDPDGFRCTARAARRARAAGARGVVFPMHEPDGYPPANDRVIEEAERARTAGWSPFCRLDPADDAAGRGRALPGRRARAGIKLHPRAEDFALDHPALRDVFALADERRLPVLVHAGRGIPALGRHAVELCGRYPGLRLILAHAGICDLAWIWRDGADLPQPLLRHLVVVAQRPAGAVRARAARARSCSRSDAPYGTPDDCAAVLGLRYALQVGLDARSRSGRVIGRPDRSGSWRARSRSTSARRRGRRPSRDPLLDRVYTFLVAAIGQVLQGVTPPRRSSWRGSPARWATTRPQAPVCRWIAVGLLDSARRSTRARRGRTSARRASRPGLPLLVLAAAARPDAGRGRSAVPVFRASRDVRLGAALADLDRTNPILEPVRLEPAGVW